MTKPKKRSHHKAKVLSPDVRIRTTPAWEKQAHKEAAPVSTPKIQKRPENEKDDDLKSYVEKAKWATRDPVTGRDDAFVTLLEKWTPVLLPFIQGFLGNMAARQQAAPQQHMIAPPPGWLGMSALQKFSSKHTRPEWYSQGIAYDNAMRGGSTQPAIDYAPAGAVPQSRQQAPPQEAPAVDRTDELPLVDMNAKPAQDPPAQDPQPAPPAQQAQPAQQAPAQQAPDNTMTPPTPEQQAQAMKDALITRLASTDPAVVVAKAQAPEKDLQALVDTYKDFVAPVILKAMLAKPWATAKHDGMVDELAAKCPEQHKALDDEALLPKIGMIYDKLRKKVGA